MKPNIGKPLRIAYVTIGLILVLGPFMIPFVEPWIRIVAPILGVLSIIGGATGR